MKRHGTDAVSLTFGLVFSLIAGWWLTAQLVDIPLPQVGWVLAGGLILLGVLGLVGALRTGRSTGPPSTAPAESGRDGDGLGAGLSDPAVEDPTRT